MTKKHKHEFLQIFAKLTVQTEQTLGGTIAVAFAAMKVRSRGPPVRIRPLTLGHRLFTREICMHGIEARLAFEPRLTRPLCRLRARAHLFRFGERLDLEDLDNDSFRG